MEEANSRTISACLKLSCYVLQTRREEYDVLNTAFPLGESVRNGNSRQFIVDTETSRRSTVCVVCETEFSRPSDKKRR